MSYVSTKKAQEYYGVTSQTLRNWADMGKIKYRRTTGNHRFISLMKRLKIKNQKEILSILEFLLINRKTILKDKKIICLKDSQIMKSSKILDQDLTSKEKGLYPFWTDQKKEISEKLWYTQKTDYVDLVSNYSNIYSENTLLNSWFSTVVSVN
jgi:DNA-binding transcriptional MerR regulator